MPSFNNYLQALATYFKDPTSSEMSYRADFQKFLETIFPKTEKYHIQHDPKVTAGNKPDFIVIKNGVPLLYIEVKKVGEDLDKIEKSSQASRYFGYTNLIISDYLEFRFYRNGQKYNESIKLGEPNLKTKEIVFHGENEAKLVGTILDFITSHKEPIKSGKHLAQIMGGKAKRIRDNVIAFLNLEKAENEELIKIMNVIRQNLVADIDTEKFADMYAQTLVYGLFVARYNDKTPNTFTRQEARDLVPKTNPFLRHFFDHIAGTDFPKRLDVIVGELCEVFTHADVRDLIKEYFLHKDLSNQVHKSADPIIHFYEDFLLEYDPAKKMEMGVFYTPKSVVRFIVRSIDSILKNEFGIVKGLADNQKFIQEVKSVDHKGKKTKITKEVHKVQVLDIATGTGTFLNEVIQNIFQYYKGHEGAWPLYVENDLIPRLFGFELMMASYTIAHLKLAMTLERTGISEVKKRLGVYLTNTLDEAKDYSTQGAFFGFLDSIADESKSASRIKKEFPIMAIIGNPPYSGISQNKHYTDNNVYKVEPGGKQKLQERKHWLDDDYVKFIRFAESLVERNGEGVIGMITAHGYIDNPTFRGMRWHLRKTFNKIYVLDLHGNSNKKETALDGSKDENVFDIKTGVAILFGVKKKSESKGKKLATVYCNDFFGIREQKQAELDKNNIFSIKWAELPKNANVWKVEGEGKREYLKGFSINELFPKNTTGIVTMGDGFIINENKEELKKRVEKFLQEDLNEATLKDKYNLGKNYAKWIIKNKTKIENDLGKIVKIAYRPFDTKYTYFDKNLVWRTRDQVMKHFIERENVGLVCMRQATDDSSYNHVLLSKYLVDNRYMYSGKGITIQAPLYLYSENGERELNLNKKILDKINKVAGETVPENVLDYVYAYLHSPKYREKFKEFLKTDFPRVPFPVKRKEFWRLVELGRKLRGLHLLTDPVVKGPITTFPVAGSNEILKVRFVELIGSGPTKMGKVFINETQYFGNVPEDVWNFYIGGYQPAQKFLKDRKGKVLSNSDIERYEEIIVALNETGKVMREVDEK